MKDKRSRALIRGTLQAASAAVICLAAAPTLAQDAGRPFTGTVSPDPNPYYIGVSQGFTHDSNVYRIPSGPSDIYSSTSVFGGFDQPISRQRVFGRANVSLNRYQDEDRLNNTSYDLSAGANLETIENISGNLNLGLSQSLVAPPANVGVPTAVRNKAQTQRVDARLRWGGPALLTVEGSAGYLRLDYSAPEYVTSETRESTTSIGVFYRPGALLRVGVAGRFERTRTPQAVLDPLNGTYQSNTSDGRNLDLLADYRYGGSLSGNARLSYTRQSNSQVTAGDFSGLTGSLAVNWQATGKTAFQFHVSRDAGFESGGTTRYSVTESGTGVILTPVTALYESNRVTDTVMLGVTYAATAKIGASANVRYARAHLVSAAAAGSGADTTDVSKGVHFGVQYAITRAWSASCNLAHEERDVSGAVVYSYSANSIGCATQFTWR